MLIEVWISTLSWAFACEGPFIVNSAFGKFFRIGPCGFSCRSVQKLQSKEVKGHKFDGASPNLKGTHLIGFILLSLFLFLVEVVPDG